MTVTPGVAKVGGAQGETFCTGGHTVPPLPAEMALLDFNNSVIGGGAPTVVLALPRWMQPPPAVPPAQVTHLILGEGPGNPTGTLAWLWGDSGGHQGR